MTREEKSKVSCSNRLAFLFCLLYFTSYITRKSFSAIKLGLPEGYMAEAQIGLIGSTLFFAYGIGQPISGILGDRIDPRRLILMGLGTTAVCNAAFPFITSVPALAVLWAINGFAQAMFWPPMVKLMSVYFQGDRYIKVSTRVSMAAQVALLAVSALASLAIRLAAWKSIFAISVAMAVITAAALTFGFRAMERHYPGAVSASMKKSSTVPDASPTQGHDIPPSHSLWAVILASGLMLVFVMTALLGFLRDGLEEWRSTYLLQTFSLTAEFSTLLDILFPLFTIVCVKLTAYLYKHVFHDEIVQTLAATSVSLLSTLLLILFGGTNLWLAILLLISAVGSIHMSNICLTGYIPARYANSGKVATVAGLVNAFTYIGSTIAASALPRIFGQYSWTAALLACAGVAAACIVCALLIIRRWMRWKKQ